MYRMTSFLIHTCKNLAAQRANLSCPCLCGTCPLGYPAKMTKKKEVEPTSVVKPTFDRKAWSVNVEVSCLRTTEAEPLPYIPVAIS
jgi:hypothetical protein